MEVSIVPNKATLVAQLSLFKSLGDMRVGEESEVTCVRKLYAMVWARLEKKSN